MIKKAIFFLSITLLSCVAYSTPQDSLYSQQLFDNFSLQRRELSWMQLGFRIGYNISLTDQYSPTDEMKNLFSANSAHCPFGNMCTQKSASAICFIKDTTLPFSHPARSATKLWKPVSCKSPSKQSVIFHWKRNLPSSRRSGSLQPLIQVSETTSVFKKNSPPPNFCHASLGVRISYFTLKLPIESPSPPFFSDRTSRNQAIFPLWQDLCFFFHYHQRIRKKKRFFFKKNKYTNKKRCFWQPLNEREFKLSWFRASALQAEGRGSNPSTPTKRQRTYNIM